MAADATFYRKASWVRGYFLDWSNYAEFVGNSPQTIVSGTIAAVTGITFGSVTVTGLQTSWQTTGGTAGTSYATVVTITLSGGGTLSADVVFVTET